MISHTLRIKWLLLLIIIFSQVALAWSEMYVEGYGGGVKGTDTKMETSTPPVQYIDVLSGCTRSSKAVRHELQGRLDPAVMGGLKVGTWFTPKGILGYRYPKYMKYFGFYLDFNYHRLSFARQTGKTLDYTVSVIPGLVSESRISTQQNIFWSDGYAATLAFMFTGRLGFLPDSEVPFGRLQPYVAVGPALIFSGQDASLMYTDSYGMQHGFSDSANSVDIGLATDAGIRYMALKNVSIDIFFRYRYANPTYRFSYFTLRPTYNLLSGGVGVAYHF